MNTTSSKTIFITGATGLVGSHAAEEALKRGHRVRALVRPTSDTRWLDQWGVETIVGDLEDPEALRAGVAGADWVFNCAAKVGDWGTLAEFRRLNVEALRLLLDAAVRRPGRAVRPRELAGRVRRPRPLRDRRDRAPGREFARCLHAIQDRGRGPGPRVSSPARAARGDRPAGVHLRRARPHRPAQAAARTSGAARSPTSAPATRCSTASTSRTWSTGSFWPPRTPRPSARSST